MIDDLKDEKYEQTPISELYSVFRVSAKQEPTELINFPSPPTLPDIVTPREVKLDEPDVHVKLEAAELPERKSEETGGEEKEVKEETVAEKWYVACSSEECCYSHPLLKSYALLRFSVEVLTESANEKPDSGVIAR